MLSILILSPLAVLALIEETYMKYLYGVTFYSIPSSELNIFGSGALSGKMLFVRIVENNKINDDFRAG